VIFVSHNMPMISRICSQIILMDHGQIKYQGDDVSLGIDEYYNKFISNEESSLVYTDNSISLESASIEGLEPVNDIYEVNWGDTIQLNYRIKNIALTKIPYISLVIYDKEQRGVAEILPEGQHIDKIENKGFIEFSFLLKNIYLSKGIYNITFTASET